ncbi:MAG: hypothetical protein JXN62_09800 [Bacteroidales bacterium]|nr:hypothetical protein [Bacteroidales bacterium]
MKRISAYIISITLMLFNVTLRGQEAAPDTDSVDISLKIKAGLEISGPVIFFTDENTLNTEGFISYDLNEKLALYAGGGYSDYKYSQYNYSFSNKGLFLKAGVDINLLSPEIANSRYWAGIGLRYGISRFTCEIPFFSYENYWGKVSSSLAPETNWGHYLEISPGFRAEVLKNFSIGWSVSLRKLLFTSTGKDLKPIYFPGYGPASESFSTGISYFISWNIPYKKIRVQVKPKAPETTEEDQDGGSIPNTIRSVR